METSKHVRGLINSWSKYGSAPPPYVVHVSGRGDFFFFTPAEHKDMHVARVRQRARVPALILNISYYQTIRTTSVSSLPYLCCLFQDAGNWLSRLLPGTVSCSGCCICAAPLWRSQRFKDFERTALCLTQFYWHFLFSWSIWNWCWLCFLKQERKDVWSCWGGINE